jgi:transposase
MKFVAGVDCHKHSHTIVVLDHLGVQQGSWKISADPDGYEKGIEAVAAFSDVVWGIESTGFYGYGFAQALVARGYLVFEVPGTVTKRYRRQGTRRGKSDPLDARAIEPNKNTAYKKARRPCPRHDSKLPQGPVRVATTSPVALNLGRRAN